MTDMHEEEVELATALTDGRIIDRVYNAALDLLASLPQCPERLRVSAADVTVDLSWPAQPTPTAASAPGPASVQPTGHSPGELTPGEGIGSAADERQPALHHICAPAVGTFYHAPEPGAAPFAGEGTIVNPGQQVGIIEAMKLMLPVETDQAGQVLEVLAADGEAVEYAQRLLALGPAD